MRDRRGNKQDTRERPFKVEEGVPAGKSYDNQIELSKTYYRLDLHIPQP